MKIISISRCMLIVCFYFTSVFLSTGKPAKEERNIKENYRNRLLVNIPEDSINMLDFVFKDSLNRSVRITDFKGKVILVDIWYSGCGACIKVNQALYPIHDALRKENVVFLSISVDESKEEWIQSITPNAIPSKLHLWAGKYCPSPGTVALFTGGTGTNNEFIKTYVPNNLYPKLLLIDTLGNIFSRQPPRPDAEPKKLMDMILKAMGSK